MDTTQYFYRNSIISKKGNTISLADIDNPKQQGEVLESWFGIVMTLADGQHSIDELVQYMAAHYPQGAPHNLKDTLVSVVERLSDSRLIVLSKEKVELPYYLSAPIEQLDLDVARKQMELERKDVN